MPLDAPAAAPLVDATPDLFTPPWWLQAPLPVLVEVVPSLQSTGAAFVVVAESAVLLAVGAGVEAAPLDDSGAAALVDATPDLFTPPW